MIKSLLVIVAAIAVVVVGNTSVTSAQAVQQVTICHATSSNPNSNNPYNMLTLPPQAIENAGHFEHDEVAVTSQAEYEQFKAQHQHWGDIIPPFGNFQGLNWNPITEAIRDNGCNFTDPVDPVDPTDPGEPGRGGDEPIVAETSTQAAPQVDAPIAGVNAGAGAIASVGAALAASTASIALGVRRLLKVVR